MEERRTEGGPRYTRGRRGPESRTRFTIVDAEIAPGGHMAKGHAVAHLKKGDRGVRFLVQGRNLNEIRDRLVANGEFLSKARWTGREAVTLTGLAHVQPTA